MESPKRVLACHSYRMQSPPLRSGSKAPMGPSDSRAPLGKLEEMALRSLTPHPIYFVIHLFASLPLSICSIYFVPDTVLTNVASIKSYAPWDSQSIIIPKILLRGQSRTDQRPGALLGLWPCFEVHLSVRCRWGGLECRRLLLHRTSTAAQLGIAPRESTT